MENQQSYNFDGKTTIKFVCTSDTHTNEKELPLPKGDVFIHAGDFTYTGQPKEVAAFNDFLKQAPYEVKIVIAGNHELTFDVENYDKKFRNTRHDFIKEKIDAQQVKNLLKDCIYLEDSSININGIKIYGSPYTPELCGWAFMLDFEDGSLERKWKQIPQDTDILITHGPPDGILDREQGMGYGCPFLKEAVLNRIKPKYHIFGHVHESQGQLKIDDTTFINCAFLDYKYEPGAQDPICFDYQL